MTDEVQSTVGTSILMDGVIIGEIYDPPTIGASGSEKDTTAQNNIGGVKSKVITLIEHENATFNVQYTGATVQNTLLAEIYDREVHTFQVVFPPTFHDGGHSITWSGQVKGSKLVNDGETAHIEMEVTVNSKPAHITTWATGLTTPFFSILDNDSNALTPSPVASATAYECQVEAYSDDTGVTITPTATTGTIRVNGTVVTSGAASGTIPLNTSGPTMVSIVVSEVNKTPKIHWLRFYFGPTAHP